MATYIVLGNFTDQGIRNVKDTVKRADAVKDYLAGRGVPAERMTALGAGPDHPVAGNDTAAGRARNRRIELKLTNR